MALSKFKFSELLQQLKTHDCLRLEQEVKNLHTNALCHYIFLWSKMYTANGQLHKDRKGHLQKKKKKIIYECCKHT